MDGNTKEKLCAFFASDYHFEMISLPYINNKIQNNKEIIIFTENDLEETINKLISRINLKEVDKNKILNINWKNDDVKKEEKIKENIKNKKETIIFVKGKTKYIENVNKNIEKNIDNNDVIKIVDCYDIEEIKDNISNIAIKYDAILSTKGKNEIL